MRTINRDIAGGFIFSGDGKLLIGKSIKGGAYDGQWIIPGGGIEENETKREALIREILEETGLDITHANINALDEIDSGETEKILRDTGEKVLVKMQFYNFIVKLEDNADTIVLKTDDDFIDARWANVEELSTLDLSSPTIITLKKLGYISEDA